MEDLVSFIVENRDYIWILEAFLVFVYFAKFFIILVMTTFNTKKLLNIKGRVRGRVK
jgi:hypothetical protein